MSTDEDSPTSGSQGQRNHALHECGHRFLCPCEHDEDPFRSYELVESYEIRIRHSSAGSVLRERSTAIPRTTVAISIFFLCTGFQYVAHQLSTVPEECYDNRLCIAFGRRWNVKNWNGVLSSVFLYELAGWIPLLCNVLPCCSKPISESDVRSQVSHGLRVNACIAVIFHGFLAGLYGLCPTPTNQQFVYIGLTMVTNSFFIMEWSKRHPFVLSAGSYALFFAVICVVITLDNVGKQAQQAQFSMAAWGLAALGWLFGMPRYFMLLHFGIPNILPAKEELEQMSDARENGDRENGDHERGRASSCTCRTTLCKVLAKVDTVMKCISTATYVLGFMILLVLCWRGEFLSFVIMIESSLVLLVYVVCHTIQVFCEYHEGKFKPDCPPQGSEESNPLLARRSDSTDAQNSCGAARVALVAFMIVLTVLLGSLAMFMFLTDSFSTRKSKSESAEMGQNCAFFGYFDNHDAFNLLSGCGLMLFVFTSGMLDKLHRERPNLKVI